MQRHLEPCRAAVCARGGGETGARDARARAFGVGRTSRASAVAGPTDAPSVADDETTTSETTRDEASGGDEDGGDARERGGDDTDGDRAGDGVESVEGGAPVDAPVDVSASVELAPQESEELNRRRKRDYFAESLASFGRLTKTESDKKSTTPIKVSDKEKVLREWGDSLSWDGNRLDGTTLDGTEAPSADVFDGILSQAPVDLDEMESADAAREAAREAKRVAKERAKAEKEKKRLAKEKARAFAKEASKGKKSEGWDVSFDFDDIDDDDDEEQEGEPQKSIIEMAKDVLNSDAARWALKFYIVPSVVAQALQVSIIDPIISEQLKLASADHTAIELSEDQEFTILERTRKFEQRIDFETLMGRQAPMTAIEKADKVRHEADRLEAEEILHTVEVNGNRYGDLVFFAAVLTSLVYYADDAKIAVKGAKATFFNLAPAQQAFILLLSSDVLVGYHSADGWQTVLRQIGGHYGIKEQEDAISIFVSLVPVGVDVLFKFWVFKYLRRIAPSTQVILEDIDRH